LVLGVEPLCRECAKHGITRAANHVDHISGDPSNNDLTNLQPLCAPCHSRKTAAEDGGFGNPKGRGGSKV
jgi:5-methylcytosine-specific restriction protein A